MRFEEEKDFESLKFGSLIEVENGESDGKRTISLKLQIIIKVMEIKTRLRHFVPGLFRVFFVAENWIL